MASILELAANGGLAQNLETATMIPQGDHVIQRKYDGWRIIAYIGEGEVTMFARSGKTYSGRLPHVEAEMLAAFPAGTWLDGEAVSLRMEDGKIWNDWHVAQSALTTQGPKGAAVAAKVGYVVFDLLAHGGIDARPLGYGKRHALLTQIFDGAGFKALSLAENYPATMEAHATNLALGFEGSVVKRLNAPYATGKRGHGMLRLKPQTTIDAVIMGYKPGENGFSGLVGAIIFGQYDENGELVERGRCSGMDMRTRVDMTQNFESKWKGRVVEIAHMGVSIGASESGRFRHPQFKRVRKDKAPQEVVVHDG